MGITPNDIAAQRAMLERGEALAAVKNHHAERVRLRDTFAAAALTGLLADDGDRTDHAMPNFTARAYEWADAMLRERQRNGAVEGSETVQSGRPSGVSDAWAVAANQQLRERGHYGSSFPYVQGPRSTNHAAAGTGNTPSKAEIDALEFVVEEGRIASMDDYGILRSWLIRLRPEWENQSYEESDEKRTNTTMNRVDDEIAIEAAWDRTGLNPTWPDDEAGCGVKYAHAMADEILRLREAIRRLADQDATISVQGGSVTVTVDAALTDEERAAIEWFAQIGDGPLAPWSNNWSNHAATLRSLLERLK